MSSTAECLFLLNLPCSPRSCSFFVPKVTSRGFIIAVGAARRMLHQRGEVPRHASALFVVGALIAGIVCYQSYASSDAQVTPTLAPGVDGGFTASVSVAGAVTTEPSYLLLDKNFLSFTGSFDVFDAFGVDVYYVKGKVVSLRKRKAIVPLTTGSVDEAATSPPLAFVQKKLVGLRKVYEIIGTRLPSRVKRPLRRTTVSASPPL